MKKIIRKLPPKTVTIMFVASILILLSGTVGGARAALTYYSDTYSSRVSMYNIGVTLWEQGQNDEAYKKVSWRNYDSEGDWDISGAADEELLTGMLLDGETPNIGQIYRENLKVSNTGAIGEYVRVTIYKYWLDENGKRLPTVGMEGAVSEEEIAKNGDHTLDVSVIQLNYAMEGDWGDDWEEDTAASTPERTVLYYKKLLSVGEETSCFVNNLRIDPKITNLVTEEVTEKGEFKTIKSTYDYDDKQFCIEVEVDAVQDHNAADAIMSTWGRSVTVENGYLTLN